MYLTSIVSKPIFLIKFAGFFAACLLIVGCGKSNEADSEPGPANNEMNQADKKRPPLVINKERPRHPEFHPRMAFVADEGNFRSSFDGLINDSFQAKDFERLEIIADLYRKDGGARTGSGLFKQLFFYGAFKSRYYANRYGVREEAQATLDDWIKAYPESLAPYLAKANMLFEASKQTQEYGSNAPNEIAHYYKQLDRAYDYLLENWSLVESEADAYRLLLRLTLYRPQSRDNWREVYERARENFPGYHQIYFDVIWYAPNYGGENDPLAFIEEIATDLATDTPEEKNSGYARTYWAAAQHDPLIFQLMRARVIDWKPVRDGYHDIIALYPDPWNANALAFYSCVMGDQKTFKDTFDVISEHFAEGVWNDYTREICLAWAEHRGPDPYYIRTEPAGGA